MSNVHGRADFQFNEVRMGSDKEIQNNYGKFR